MATRGVVLGGLRVLTPPYKFQNEANFYLAIVISTFCSRALSIILIALQPGGRLTISEIEGVFS